MSEVAGCCDAPRQLPAFIDRVATTSGVRFRHIPGSVCLRCRDVRAPHVTASPDLTAELQRLLSGDAGALTVLKVDAADSPGEGRCVCGALTHDAAIDAGVGAAAGLVIERLAGRWCAPCGTATITRAVDQIRARIARLDRDGDVVLSPSLLYDTPGHPASLQFEITTRCNLACAYCSHRQITNPGDLPIGAFLQTLDRIELRAVDNVDFTGLGEPLLHPDLPAMVRAVRARGAPTHLRLVTNGTVLGRARAEALIEAGITSLGISIDSMDPVRFARSRGGARLDKVLANVRALVALRATLGTGRPRIRIKSVLIEDVYAEAEALLRFSADLGLEMPHFSRLDTRSSARAQYQESWLDADLVQSAAADFTSWVEDRWRALAGPGRGPISDELAPVRPRGYANPALAPQSDLCRWAIDAAFIAAGADSLACCEQMIDLPRTYWGSLRTSTMRELWGNELLWGYRLPLSLGAIPSHCAGCAWAPRHGQLMVPASPRTGRTMPILS